MEGPPLVSRHSIDDDDVQGLGYGVGDGNSGPFSAALLEPNVHDVMSMELAHHDMGGYLDPRSFGGGTLGFDDYNINPSPQIKVVERTEHPPPVIPSNKYENTLRYDQTRNVPTYPVKTADPSTCTQYAPVRTLMSSSIKSQGTTPSRRTTSRSAQKKEAIDPKRVEDEVARNVSQILSATKQQRLAMEAQQRNGTAAPQPPRIAYACPDCHKTVTSARNLQRHRQTCTARVNGGTGVMGMPSSSSVSSSSVAICPTSTSVMISPTSSYSNLSYGNYNMSTEDHHYADWSRSNSYSAPQSVSSQHERSLNEPAEQLGTLDPNSHDWLEEDSAFRCESCKKSVSSLRSLKRHHTTCKQYIAENGPPPESDRSSSSFRSSNSTTSSAGDLLILAEGATAVNSSVSHVVNSSQQSSLSLPPPPPLQTTVATVGPDHPIQFDSCPAKAPPQLPLVTSSSCRCSLTDCNCTPSASPQQSVSCIPKLAANNNTCEDCNRQLCSASNLKRHRATCKIVMQKQYSRNGGVVSPVSKPTQQKWQPVEIAARERMIIDRSYAAALAASQEARQHLSHQPQMITRTGTDNTGAFVIVQDQGVVGERPWITVGEHLRAQHMQQKVLEAQSLQQQNQNQPVASAAPAQPSDHAAPAESAKVLLNNNNETGTEEQGSEDKDALDEENTKGQEGMNQFSERKPSLTSYKCTNNVISRIPVSQPATVMRCSSTVEQKPIYDERVDTFSSSRSLGDRRSSDSIQTTIPAVGPTSLLTSTRQPASLSSEFQCPECLKTYSCRKNVKRHRMAVHKLSAEEVSRPMSASNSMGCSSDSTSFSQLSQPMSSRMTVTRNEYKPEGHMMGSPQPLMHQNRYQERVSNSWGTSHQMQHQHIEGSWSRNRDYVDDEESAETARIAAELKRSAEQEMAEIEGKKPRTELAEADTTFHEETEPGSAHLSDANRLHCMTSADANQPTAGASAHSTMNSWMEQKPLAMDVTHATRSTAQGSPSSARVNKRPPHVCVDCNRVLSSDYSLRRHRLTCIEARNNGATQSTSQSGTATTNTSSLGEESAHLQDVMLGSAYIGGDRNNVIAINFLFLDKFSERLKVQDSMGMSDPMLSHVALSTPMHQQGMQFNRSTSLSASGSSSAVDEWYERHSLRKTDDVPDSTTSQRLDRSTSPGLLSTPSDGAQPGCLQYTRKRANSGGANAQSDSVPSRPQHKHLCQACGKFYSSEWNLERHRRESCPVKGKASPAPREPSALSRASAYFAQLFAMHDPSKGELRLELDPSHFQSLLDVYNNPNNLNQYNIDAVVVLANRLKFCTLPQISVMHAIRLAEQLKLSAIKQRLFDTISIDVFRSLASDEQYKKMDAELKAELLEKWGTFL
ncbi:zinc finger, C2H2 type [Ancylostoma ceylanicum]|uniref:Zinc finger, C2H2 type n=1 Tax=Ancylostoma ceylanicum TaxID=53326 RepID=A0A0D6LIQ2_9BILA|nr:zinc finger, C2H2 type [Ancylostoma ceylanicum]